MGNNQHTIEQIFQIAQDKGLKARSWTWAELKNYNGFSHDQRVRKWQALDLAIRIGMEPPANTFPCALCGKSGTDAHISYHSEDYARLDGHYPLCKSCHTRIHQRFKNQASWQNYISNYGDGSQWFHCLVMEEKSVIQDKIRF